MKTNFYLVDLISSNCVPTFSDLFNRMVIYRTHNSLLNYIWNGFLTYFIN